MLVSLAVLNHGLLYRHKSRGKILCTEKNPKRWHEAALLGIKISNLRIKTCVIRISRISRFRRDLGIPIR